MTEAMTEKTEAMTEEVLMKNIQIEDESMFDFTDESYRSADAFKTEFPMFPDEYYNILELHANGVTPKQHKRMVKNKEKRQLKKQGVKINNI